MKKTLFMSMLWIFASAFGNNNNTTLNPNGEKHINQRVVSDREVDHFINKHEDSDIVYRQNPENEIIDVSKLNLQEAFKMNIGISFVKFQSSNLYNATRNPNKNIQLFLEQYPQVTHDAVEYGNLKLVKFLKKHGAKFNQADLNTAEKSNNEKMVEYLRNILSN